MNRDRGAHGQRRSPRRATRSWRRTSATPGPMTHSEPERTGAIVRAQYEEQLGWAKEEGVDFVIHETNDYLAEALIGLEVALELGLPAMVTFASVHPAPHLRRALSTWRRARRFADAGADAGGSELLARARDDAAAAGAESGPPSTVAVAAQPVPFRTTHAGAGVRVADHARRWREPSRSRWKRYSCSRFEMADFARWAAARGRSTTSGSAAAADPITSAPWPRRSDGSRAGQPLLAGDRAAPGARHGRGRRARGDGRLDRGRLRVRAVWAVPRLAPGRRIVA